MDGTSQNPRKSQTGSRTRYWILFSILLLLAAALVLPPLINLNRYQHRIANIISSGLGRPVHLSSVTLRLLPRPGLELSDFVVDEDPAFGMEPTLRSPSVDASIRLSSLWRGRLEIGRISFDQPSLNLVRNHEGRWNIGTVLLQASRIPNAPTAQRRATAAPRFPYIEATNARVNFKSGSEKKPFSFMNADFSAWLANPDEWQIRLEAQPARTDLDLGLADTGLVRMEGSLHRASAFGEMPVDLHVRWSNAPLGQMARLFTGQDTGWRGGLQIDADITGDVYNPRLKTRLRIAEMHRQEFTPADPFNVDATCETEYRQGSHSLNGLTCLWPIDAGHLLLTGDRLDIEHPQPAFTLQMQNVPAAFGLSALRLLRNGFAPSAQVSGSIQGRLVYASAPIKKLSGEAVVNGLTVRADGMKTPLTVPTLHIASSRPYSGPPPVARHARKVKARPVVVSSSLHLDGANIALGGATPLTVSADFASTGFSLHFAGDAALERLLPLAANFGLLRNTASALAPQRPANGSANGTANLDLTVHGPWLSQSDVLNQLEDHSVTEGTLRLKDAVYQAAFLPGPVTIVSAQANFSPTQVVWDPVSVVFQKMPATLSVTAPLQCPAAKCTREFSLTTPSLDAVALQSAIMGAGEHGELLQQILVRLDQNKVQWPALTGTVHTALFTLGPLALHDAGSTLHIEGRQMQFTSIDAHTLGGALHATGLLDASAGTPHYIFDAQLQRASAAGITTLWREAEASGTVNANAHVESTGYSAKELASSAKGTFQWDWSQGAFSGAPFTAPAELARFDHWSAGGIIKDAAFLLDHSQITRGQMKEPVSGTISFDRKMDLTVGNGTTEAHVAKAATQHAPE